MSAADLYHYIDVYRSKKMHKNSVIFIRFLIDEIGNDYGKEVGKLHTGFASLIRKILKEIDKIYGGSYNG
jgi:hypothetical protein